ncbi:tetrahydrocannabinolic acid synthase-like [Dorcoceras hygrometricum]|uniref:Tetrahydrocannabinolic acid synthase-like n=1 Tax=Dorcoceras hygrometricum TaxID=472368 RepID=A0A2Z7CAY6_9LAMI|nr:tetrahydrocannabinolic acid synthase-like [Dorcoceras hygrometricum]
MGNADPHKTKVGNKYEVKPQYEEQTKQINMQHAINQCNECMMASNEISQLGQCINRQNISGRLYTTANQPHVKHTASNQISPGSIHAAGNFLEAEICYSSSQQEMLTLKLNPAEDPTITLERRHSSFALSLQGRSTASNWYQSKEEFIMNPAPPKTLKSSAENGRNLEKKCSGEQ